ncbi:MAG: response regulator [Burkholderiales bacterium]|nr:response regulator [Burkholderiales bacterium]
MKLILIIEDNAMNMKLVRDVLRVKGYDTLEAATAEDGLRIARERHPDLILMDIQLPGMNGVDAIKLLRADPAVANTRVVAITASVMQHDTQRIMRAGFDGFIEKPINLRTFLATVRQAMRAGNA